MRTILFSTLALSFFALTACGGSEPAAPAAGHDAPAAGHDAPAAGHDAPAAAAPAADAPAAAAAAADEPVICCEFNGAVGTSTKTMCDEYKGVVVADDKCKK